MGKHLKQIIWHSPAHERREHSADWYWAISIVTIALVVAFVIVGNILLSVVIGIGIGTLLATASREPKVIEYALERKGIRIGTRVYPWDTLDSFWILDETKDTVAKLLITSKKPLMPHIVILLNNEVSHEELREVLSHAIPETPQDEPLPDRIMRKFGF